MNAVRARSVSASRCVIGMTGFPLVCPQRGAVCHVSCLVSMVVQKRAMAYIHAPRYLLQGIILAAICLQLSARTYRKMCCMSVQPKCTIILLKMRIMLGARCILPSYSDSLCINCSSVLSICPSLTLLWMCTIKASHVVACRNSLICNLYPYLFSFLPYCLCPHSVFNQFSYLLIDFRCTSECHECM
jgi:hypothetical protein